MKLPQLQWQTWILVLTVVGIIALAIWSFGVDKPSRVSQVRIALRNIDEQRAELGLLETDHEGVEYFYEADGPDLDFSLVNRPRSLYTEPITLSNDRSNAPSKARITMRGLSDSEIKLGLRTLRPNRNWGSSRFPRPEPITLDELQSEEWYYLPPLTIRILYHQPIVDTVRVFVYIAGSIGILFGLSWFAWRRWLS